METPMLQICIDMHVVSPIISHADFRAFVTQQGKSLFTSAAGPNEVHIANNVALIIFEKSTYDPHTLNYLKFTKRQLDPCDRKTQSRSRPHF